MVWGLWLFSLYFAKRVWAVLSLGFALSGVGPELKPKFKPLARGLGPCSLEAALEHPPHVEPKIVSSISENRKTYSSEPPRSESPKALVLSGPVPTSLVLGLWRNVPEPQTGSMQACLRFRRLQPHLARSSSTKNPSHIPESRIGAVCDTVLGLAFFELQYNGPQTSLRPLGYL